MKKFYMIGNTHFDPVWLWRWDEAMASIRATFRSALDRINEDEEFIYAFATPPVFEWIRKVDPEMFDQIKVAVQNKRWELAEAWWVQPDCYSASGESYVRQGLYGQRYLKENFGTYSDCVFNIDSFGHSPMLPQILKKSGIDYYCFVRPEMRHVALDRSLFKWESADKSSVLAYRVHKPYRNDVKTSFELASKDEDSLIVYGVTDHGGAPTKQAINDIHSEQRARFSTVSDFFKEHTTEYTVKGELLTKDFGPYANYSKIKKLNRIAEYAVLNAEKSALIASKDEQNALTECWKDVLFNQFHDILGGACIKDAYTDAQNQLGRAIHTANEITHFSLQSVTKNIRMLGTNPDTVWNLVVWNLSGEAFDGYVEAEVQWAHEFEWYDKGITILDGDGCAVDCQIIREKSVIPRFRSRFIFYAQIPSVGYKVFKVVRDGKEITKKQADPFFIKTNRLEVRFSKENGVIASVIDRHSVKELLSNALVPVIYDDLGDTWCFNIDSYENEPEHFLFDGSQLIESGDILTEIKNVYRAGASKLEIYYRFYSDADYFDIRYRVNWDEKHKVLKLEIPLSSDIHTAAVPAGSVQRAASDADVPLGAWINADNFTIASDSVFAYNVKENKLGLTILRSAIYGDLRISDIDKSLDYDIIDRDIVEGKIRVAFDGDPWKIAENLNDPPIIIDECNHDGDLPSMHSYFNIEARGTTISAIKRCEDDDGVIVRLIEHQNRSKIVTLSAFNERYQIEMNPCEIKTLKILNGICTEVDMIEREIPKTD